MPISPFAGLIDLYILDCSGNCSNGLLKWWMIDADCVVLFVLLVLNPSLYFSLRCLFYLVKIYQSFCNFWRCFWLIVYYIHRWPIYINYLFCQLELIALGLTWFFSHHFGVVVGTMILHSWTQYFVSYHASRFQMHSTEQRYAS